MQNECSSPVLAAVLGVTKNIMNLIGIIAPILLIIMTAVNLIRLIKNPDDKKGMPSLRNSMIAAVVIFLIPTIVNTAMYALDDTFTVSDCWNNAKSYTTSGGYIDIYGDKRKKMYTDPYDFQKGEKKKPTEGAIEGTAQQVGDVVWDPTNVTKISNLTSSQLIEVLNKAGGNAKNFIPYASALITAEQKYQVNVFFLLGVEALESGWVTSAISRNCNNLGGVRETSAHPSNGCGRNSGGGFAYFSSVNEFIDYHAKMLHNNYLTPGGAYYNGPTPAGVVKSYCPGCSNWPGDVITIANGLFKHVKEVM